MGRDTGACPCTSFTRTRVSACELLVQVCLCAWLWHISTCTLPLLCVSIPARVGDRGTQEVRLEPALAWGPWTHRSARLLGE